MTMLTDEQIAFYVRCLLGTAPENAFYRLIEAGSSAHPVLIKAYQSEPNPAKQATLIEILWQSRDPSVLEFLGEVLQSSHGEVWKSALDGIVAIQDVKGLEVLRRERERLLGENSKHSLDRLAWIDEAISQLQSEIL
jgi:hypothetical protein